MLAVEHIFQFLSIVLGTFILEDATALSVGLLVLDGALSPTLGFVGLVVGIVVGDLFLFLGGRIRPVRRFLLRRIPRTKISRARRLFKRHTVEALVVARFTPGMRAPTFFAAGFFEVSPLVFIPCVTILSVVWISVLGWILLSYGKVWAQYLLHWWGVPVAIGVVVAGLLYLRGRRRDS